MPAAGMDYEWDQIDRDNYEVGDSGETTTQENTVKIGVTSRLHRKLKAKISYKWQDIDNPFNNLNAACEPANDETGVLYSDRQDTRTATLSNQPTGVNEIKADLTWSIKPNLSLTANYQVDDNFLVGLGFSYLRYDDEPYLDDDTGEAYITNVSVSYLF